MSELPETDYILTGLKEFFTIKLDPTEIGFDVADGVMEKERILAALTHETLAAEDSEYLQHESEIAEIWGYDYIHFLLGDIDFDPLSEPPILPPTLSIVEDQIITLDQIAPLQAVLTGEHIPEDFEFLWFQVLGPENGETTFSDETSQQTEASFSEIGNYILRCRARSEEMSVQLTADVTIVVEESEPSSSSSSSSS